MKDFGIGDVPCGSCTKWYGEPHSCDAPRFCACDRTMLHPHAVAEGEVVQIAIGKPLFDWFQINVRSRGMYLFLLPSSPDELPTYSVGVGDSLMAKARAKEEA